jgi:hypothetical protein
MQPSPAEAKWLELLEPAVPVLCETLTSGGFRGFERVQYKSHANWLEMYSIVGRQTIHVSIPFGALEAGAQMDKYDIHTCIAGRTHIYYRGGNKRIHYIMDDLRDIVYDWILDTIRGERCRLRSAQLKEELVAAVWRPDRVARRLEEGGWEAVEMLA